MEFFKYKWQIYLAISISFSILFLVNTLAFRFLPIKLTLMAWAAGFLTGGMIFSIRMYENRKNKD